MSAPPGDAPKYQQVHEILEAEIKAGRWKSGDRLPSEAELVRRFGASRITVGRAVRDLQLAGIVERRAGSGTFVKPSAGTGGLSFGLLIPDLGETEIFEPICQGMMASPQARQHALIWGSLPGDAAADAKGQRAFALCRQYIERKVAGVFFAPLEHAADKDRINAEIARALDDARIPVVLLDRTVLPYPRRGHHDLVGIDNRRAGYLVTEHLLTQGARRIAFVARPNAAATVAAREAGYREALYAWQVAIDRALIRHIDFQDARGDGPGDAPAVRALMQTDRPDAIVCANDGTAARLQRTLLDLGYAVPADVRMVGIDDVAYAGLLPVPLTTLRQPTRDLGAAALSAMLDRVGGVQLPTRDILLHGSLVIRKSCGAGQPPRSCI